jgi:hypothetical protein
MGSRGGCGELTGSEDCLERVRQDAHRLAGSTG